MAFENPFLKPSATRQSALKYLFSDEPDTMTTSSGFQPSSSASIVDNVFDISGSTDEISAIAANIFQNGGEFNAEQGFDVANYDPVAALNGLSQYGSIVKGALSFLGLGDLVGVGMSLAEQHAANNIDTMLQSLQGDTSGQSNLTLSTIGGIAGIVGVPFVGAGLGANKDSVANAKGLASNFQTVDQLAGYISGTDPAIQTIVGNMFEDWSTITPAQFGTVAQEVSSYVQNQVAGGKSLQEAQREAANFYTPVASAPAGNNPDEIVTPPGSYDEIPGLLTGGGDSTPTAPSAGSYWTDAAGNPIQSGSGGYVYSGSATPADIAAGRGGVPAPAPAPVGTLIEGSWVTSSSTPTSGGGGGNSHDRGITGGNSFGGNNADGGGYNE